MPSAQFRATMIGTRGFICLSIFALATFSASQTYAQTSVDLTLPPPPTGETRHMNGETTPGVNDQQGVPTVIPSGLTYALGVDLSETYTNNAFGLGTGANDADYITTVALTLAAHDQTARFTGALQYSLNGLLYADHSSYDGIYNNLTALGSATLIPEHLIVQAQAFAAPILINSLGPLSGSNIPAAGGINTGTRDVYGYSVTPDITFRLGNFARSDTFLSQSGVFYIQPSGPTVTQIIPGLTSPTQTLVYSASERISSGSDFFQFNWDMTGSWNRYVETGGGEFTEESAVADLKYGLSREFALLATGGYESYVSTEALTQSLSGPIVLVGAQATLGPAFHADFRYGRQFNFPSYVGDLNYQLGPFTSIVASATDTVSTPSGQLLNGLNLLGTDNQGNLINTNYQGAPTAPSAPSSVTGFNPAPPGGLSLTNALAHYRTISASIVHSIDRTQFRITGFDTTYDAVTINSGLPNQTSYGLQAVISRNMTPRLTGSLEADYSVQNMLGGQFSLLGGNFAINYALTPWLNAYLRGTYQQRISDAAILANSPLSGNVSQATITIGIHQTL
jgi:uncharacterized protein (PEP-CTERM system associated)